MSARVVGVRVSSLSLEHRNFNMMLKKTYLILLVSLLANCSIAQTSDIANIIERSVASYIQYRDSFYINLFVPVDETHLKIFVLPELIGANKMHFNPHPTNAERPIVWVTKRLPVKALIRKKRSRDYKGYFRTALNIERGKIAVYITRGYRYKIGETLMGRFTYGIKDGRLCLHTVKYYWNDTYLVYDNPDARDVIEEQTINKMYGMCLDEFRSFFNDTVDIIESTTICEGDRVEVPGYHFNYLWSYLRLQKTGLSVDYTFNSKGDIICFFRLIEPARHKGLYYIMQQKSSSCFIVVLTPDSSGMYQISSWHRISGNASKALKSSLF